MHTFLTAAIAFFQVVFIDLVLAGDNAIVVGVAAAGLPEASRRKAIVAGICIATILRIVLALLASMLLGLVGLLLAGGLLLLWVCWKLFRDLRKEADGSPPHNCDGGSHPNPRKSLVQAIRQIVIADVSMSIDNVLAVAGASRDHPIVMIFGLGLSVILMGVAASLIAKLLTRYRWIAYAGLFVIVAVAFDMIYRGGLEMVTALRL